MCAVTKSDLFEESLSWLYIHIPLPYYVHTCTSHKEHVSLGCVRTSSQVFKVKDWSQICLKSSFWLSFLPLGIVCMYNDVEIPVCFLCQRSRSWHSEISLSRQCFLSQWPNLAQTCLLVAMLDYINKAKSRWNFALKGKGIYMKWYLVNVFEPNKIEFISCIKLYVY